MSRQAGSGISMSKPPADAEIVQEVELGLRSLAVPVRDSWGRVVASLNTGTAAVHATPDALRDTCLPALLKVQDGLRRVLT